MNDYAQEYNQLMKTLIHQNRHVGDIKHRIVPKYIDPNLFDDPDNHVFVSYDEHFYIHKILYYRDMSSKAFHAWFCVMNMEDAKISDNDIDEVLNLASKWCGGEFNFFHGHQHKDETKEVMRKRRLKFYEDNPEAIEYLKTLMKGREGTAHTEEHKQYISDLYKGQGNPMAGVCLWNNPAAKGRDSQRAYSLMPEMHTFYQANKHKPRGWGYRAFARSINWHASPKCFQTPMKHVIQNGDPRNNAEWLEFYNDYLAKELVHTS